MKLRLVKIGRIAHPEIRVLCERYAERLAAFIKVEIHELKDDSTFSRAGERWDLATPGHLLIALDERGKLGDSRQLAAQLRGHIDNPTVKSLTFLVGGPMGLPDSWRQTATALQSLTPMTLTSDMAWLLLTEQIYRALNILKGTPYHHD